MVENWISDWQEGRQDGAQKLYDHFIAELFRLTISIVGSQQDAEEVTQDAFIYALNHIHDYDPGRSSFRTWLHMIAISRSRDRLRQRRFESLSLFSLDDKSEQYFSDDPSPEEGLIQSENKTSYLQLIQRLNPKLREAIVLRFWAEYSYKEMAYLLRCPISTAQSRVRLGLRKINDLLNKKEPKLLDVSLKRTK